ncbi:MAG: peptidoglycan-binding protein [Chloroflexi bacterium]|nr:peptidoglycan-binding protein [Chloroflexota bacterium]
MKKITFPLKSPMKRPEVGDLQDALVKLGYDVSCAERKERRFGTSTRDAVRKFHKKHGLRVTGEVNEIAANKINELISAEPASEPKTYRVSVRVVRADGTPVKDPEVKFFQQGITKVAPLGRPSSAKTDAKGNFTL